MIVADRWMIYVRQTIDTIFLQGMLFLSFIRWQMSSVPCNNQTLLVLVSLLIEELWIVVTKVFFPSHCALCMCVFFLGRNRSICVDVLPILQFEYLRLNDQMSQMRKQEQNFAESQRVTDESMHSPKNARWDHQITECQRRKASSEIKRKNDELNLYLNEVRVEHSSSSFFFSRNVNQCVRCILLWQTWLRKEYRGIFLQSSCGNFTECNDFPVGRLDLVNTMGNFICSTIR